MGSMLKFYKCKNNKSSQIAHTWLVMWLEEEGMQSMEKEQKHSKGIGRDGEGFPFFFLFFFTVILERSEKIHVWFSFTHENDSTLWSAGRPTVISFTGRRSPSRAFLCSMCVCAWACMHAHASVSSRLGPGDEWDARAHLLHFKPPPREHLVPLSGGQVGRLRPFKLLDAARWERTGSTSRDEGASKHCLATLA